MAVVAGTPVQRGHEKGSRRQLERQRLENHGPSRPDRRVRDVRQAECRG